MANAILGRKIGMSQLFGETGDLIPVTVVEAGPCPVLQVKTSEGPDGYRALQIGFGDQKPQRMKKPQLGHCSSAGVEPLRYLREIEYPEGEEVEVGSVITCDIFATGDWVDVIGVSKGKGFAGTVKRHNFGTGPKSHGSKNYREPGSTGMHTYPGRVLKGKKMPGQLGSERVTVQNLRIALVDSTNNLLYIRGAIPGASGGLVMVRRARKGGNR
jgi:large subunit ribosomal protein L3